jgi:hypothetical protein
MAPDSCASSLALLAEKMAAPRTWLSGMVSIEKPGTGTPPLA